MRRQALVEIAYLLAEVFLLQLQQRLRVAAFDAGDEKRQEAFEQVGDASEHLVPLPADLPRPSAAAKNNGGCPYEQKTLREIAKASVA